MNITKIVSLSMLFINLSSLAMNVADECTYRQAQMEDADSLLNLINNEAVLEHNMIVVLPPQHRAAALAGAIQQRRLFVATHPTQHANDAGIVGYKKLFVLTDHAEKQETLEQEIRCIGNAAQRRYAGTIHYPATNVVHNAQLAGLFGANEEALPFDCYNVCMYAGADFTSRAYRGYGINTALTNHAFGSLINQIRQQLVARQAATLSLVYGLVAANAGVQVGQPFDRTPSIARSFNGFIEELEGGINNDEPLILQHHRYAAAMPIFDLESQDEQPVPLPHNELNDFGCVLNYRLRPAHDNK